MTSRHLTAVALSLLAAAALAHEGVQNPAVMARMMAMKEIGSHMKTIGDMAKGQTAFDAAAARFAAAGIADHSARVPALFEAPETDPKSEALPAIWQDFEDFTVRSREMEETARALSQSLSGPADLQQAVAALGATCRACHQDYRE